MMEAIYAAMDVLLPFDMFSYTFMKNALLAMLLITPLFGLLGTMAVIGILVLIFLLDNRPKSPEDIMQAANIPTLAVIPSHPELSGDREHRRRRARS